MPHTILIATAEPEALRRRIPQDSGAQVSCVGFRVDPWRQAIEPNICVFHESGDTVTAWFWFHAAVRRWPHAAWHTVAHFRSFLQHDTERMDGEAFTAVQATGQVSIEFLARQWASGAFGVDSGSVAPLSYDAHLDSCLAHFEELCEQPENAELHAAWFLAVRPSAGEIAQDLGRRILEDQPRCADRINEALEPYLKAAQRDVPTDSSEPDVTITGRGRTALGLAVMDLVQATGLRCRTVRGEPGQKQAWARRWRVPVLLVYDNEAQPLEYDGRPPSNDGDRSDSGRSYDAIREHKRLSHAHHRAGLSAGTLPYVLVTAGDSIHCQRLRDSRIHGHLSFVASIDRDHLSELPRLVRSLATPDQNAGESMATSYGRLWHSDLTADALVDFGARALQTCFPTYALCAFSAASKRFPNEPDVCLGMALALRHYYGPKHDLEWLERAVAAGPRHLESWRAYALALRRVGQDSEALAAWQRVVDIEPSDAEAWLWMGEILAEQGDKSDARDAWQRAEHLGLALTPFSEVARWARRWLDGA